MASVSVEQNTIVRRTIENYLDTINKYCYEKGISRMPVPNLNYLLRGTTGGTANSTTFTISLNEILLLENWDLYQIRTIPHELAHLATTHLFGYQRQAHGRHWKFVMKTLFGLEPSRCHNMDTTNSMVRNTKYFEYTCGCNTKHVISSVKHNKILRGRTVYSCSGCRGVIYYLNKTTDKRTLMAERKAKA